MGTTGAAGLVLTGELATGLLATGEEATGEEATGLVATGELGAGEDETRREAGLEDAETGVVETSATGVLEALEIC